MRRTHIHAHVHAIVDGCRLPEMQQYLLGLDPGRVAGMAQVDEAFDLLLDKPLSRLAAAAAAPSATSANHRGEGHRGEEAMQQPLPKQVCA